MKLKRAKKEKKKKFSQRMSKLLCNASTPRSSANLKSGSLSFGFCDGSNIDKVTDFDEAITKLNKARNKCAEQVIE